MRHLVFALVIIFANAFATAEDKSVFGTHWVEFQPIQVKGELQGCQITFLTVTADRVYLNGAQVAVNGSIFLRLTDDNLALTLKVGLKEIESKTYFERPKFAYLQTPSATTAKAAQQSFDGDPGYKLFVYRATDPELMQILKDMLSSRQVTIGYNRKTVGLDVLVPLDLTVVDSKYTEDMKVHRVISPDVAASFSECTSNIIDSTLERLKN